jgi:hypothetical protein
MKYFRSVLIIVFVLVVCSFLTIPGTSAPAITNQRPATTKAPLAPGIVITSIVVGGFFGVAMKKR